jgi:hypothetical protein
VGNSKPEIAKKKPFSESSAVKGDFLTILAKRRTRFGVFPVQPAPWATVSPGNFLFIPPGAWSTGYGKFIFEPGLTELSNCSTSGDYVIVGDSDPLTTIHAFACLHQYGNYDLNLDINTAYSVLKKRAVSMPCGTSVAMLRHMLSQPLAGSHMTRTVQLITAEPFNGYNDGHVTMEVWREGRWILYDPLLHRLWTRPNGQYLNVDEFNTDGGNEYIIAPLIADNWPYEANASSGYHWPISFSCHNIQTDIVDRLYRGTVGIWHTDGRCYFPSTPNAPPNPLYTVLPYENWRALMYP